MSLLTIPLVRQGSRRHTVHKNTRIVLQHEKQVKALHLCPLTIDGKEVGDERSLGQQQRAHVLANQICADSVPCGDRLLVHVRRVEKPRHY